MRGVYRAGIPDMRGVYRAGIPDRRGVYRAGVSGTISSVFTVLPDI